MPSEVVQRADTLDAYIMDAAQSWERYQRELYESKAKGTAPPARRPSQEEMQAMLARVKNDYKNTR